MEHLRFSFLNKEQTDSNPRGEVGDNRGKKGKGHRGTCIKDPRIKPKGVELRVRESDGEKLEITVLEQQ